MNILSNLGPCDVQLANGSTIWGECHEIQLADQSCLQVVCPILNRTIRLATGSWLMISTLEKSSYEARIRNPKTLPNITRLVAHFFEMDSALFFTKVRTAEIAFARQVAMFLCYESKLYSLSVVGAYFDKRDHCTVSHAKTVVRNRMATEPETAKLVKELADTLQIAI